MKPGTGAVGQAVVPQVGAISKKVLFFDMQTGKKLRELETTYPIKGFAFYPDGSRLIAWGFDGLAGITIWDSTRGHELLTMETEFMINQAAFS